jgi:manganese efflux pump family protein
MLEPEAKMNFLDILIIAISLAMDAAAVSLGVGTTTHAVELRPKFRLAFHFGLFQFLMPLIGWLAGATVAPRLAAFDNWLTFGLLAFVGAHMVRSGLSPHLVTYQRDPSRGASLIMLSVATSLDALAVGVSLALQKVNIWYPAAVIGVVTASMSLVGLLIGNRLSETFGKRMEIVGGVTLIAIGLRILFVA